MSALADRLRALPTAALVDASSDTVWLGSSVGPLWGPASMAGPAYTVQTRRGDNRPLHLATADASPGDVMVVAAEAAVDIAIFGDLLARIARERGLAGLVTDGAVRDRDGIREVGFPVFCAGVALRPPAKAFPGVFGGPVRIGAAQVHAGDWIVGDGDGVVVVRRAVAPDVARAAEQVLLREADIVRRAGGGESSADQLGLR
jgi:4-hydroxy-4-methyl-2-oxoglutarate aldolase